MRLPNGEANLHTFVYGTAALIGTSAVGFVAGTIAHRVTTQSGYPAIPKDIRLASCVVFEDSLTTNQQTIQRLDDNRIFIRNLGSSAGRDFRVRLAFTTSGPSTPEVAILTKENPVYHLGGTATRVMASPQETNTIIDVQGTRC